MEAHVRNQALAPAEMLFPPLDVVIGKPRAPMVVDLAPDQVPPLNQESILVSKRVCLALEKIQIISTLC